MIVFLNGQFVPEEQAVVSVFDRGFLYGDGLFETMRVYRGRPFLWEEHMRRLKHGAELLKIRIPFSLDELRRQTDRLVEQNKMPESLLRLSLSRGVGPRGYSPQGADNPSLVMALHAAPVIDPANPPRWRVITSSVRLPAGELLAQVKTCNKLPQIIARTEADGAGAQEALLLNTDGEIAEASSSNLFWIERGVVCTPPLSSGALPGVTRDLVLDLCRKLGLDNLEAGIAPGGLKQAEGAFLSLTSWEIVEITRVDDEVLGQSPLVGKIREAYRKATLYPAI